MKPYLSNHAEVGDIIMSPKFGASENKHTNWVGYYGNVVTHPVRAKSKYVVEEAVMAGGGTGHGDHDIYPDGWLVTARRLNEDDSYNYKGEVIKFYQSGCFSVVIPAVEVVGKMKRTVAFTRVK